MDTPPSTAAQLIAKYESIEAQSKGEYNTPNPNTSTSTTDTIQSVYEAEMDPSLDIEDEVSHGDVENSGQCSVYETVGEVEGGNVEGDVSVYEGDAGDVGQCSVYEAVDGQLLDEGSLGEEDVGEGGVYENVEGDVRVQDCYTTEIDSYMVDVSEDVMGSYMVAESEEDDDEETMYHTAYEDSSSSEEDEEDTQASLISDSYDWNESGFI